MVAGRIAAGRVFDLESGICCGLFDRGLQRCSSAHASDVNLLIVDAADHIHVEHGYGFVERTRRLFHPCRRSKQARVLLRQKTEQNSTLQLAFHRSEQARQFEHSGGTGGVVIRSGMNLADLRRRQRIKIAAPP